MRQTLIGHDPPTLPPFGSSKFGFGNWKVAYQLMLAANHLL